MPSTLLYINASNFAEATAVYTNPSLTTFAPDNYYSDGVISRQQISGVLYAAEECPLCSTACDTEIITGTLGLGTYVSQYELGASIGAIIVNFDPDLAPKGIMVEYDGVIYNAFSSPVYGYLAGTVNLPTVLGTISSDCGVSGGSFALSEFKYSNGVFIDTGDVNLTSFVAGQMETTALTPGSCMLSIPKTAASPTTVKVTVNVPCGGEYALTVQCPQRLTTHNRSGKYASQPLACASLDAPAAAYLCPVSGVIGTYGLYDVVYIDDLAEDKLADVGGPGLGAGFYRIIGSPYSFNWYQIDANSVIIALGNC